MLFGYAFPVHGIDQPKWGFYTKSPEKKTKIKRKFIFKCVFVLNIRCLTLTWHWNRVLTVSSSYRKYNFTVTQCRSISITPSCFPVFFVHFSFAFSKWPTHTHAHAHKFICICSRCLIDSIFKSNFNSATQINAYNFSIWFFIVSLVHSLIWMSFWIFHFNLVLEFCGSDFIVRRKSIRIANGKAL